MCLLFGSMLCVFWGCGLSSKIAQTCVYSVCGMGCIRFLCICLAVFLGLGVLLGSFWALFWGPFGARVALGGLLGDPWGAFGSFAPPFGSRLGSLGTFLAHLGPSGVPLGALWGASGPTLGSFGPFPGLCWPLL